MEYEKRMPNNDYLKYWRVVRYYVKAKYGLSTPDLEMLLFLNGEKYFDKDKFREFDKLISWDRHRFDRLLRDGWIEVFRKRSKNKALYDTSYRTKRVIDKIYKQLNGEEIPTDMGNNPMFAKNVGYNDKVYRNMILQMNEFTRQQRHLSRQ
jgi:hypothetical protein